MRNIQIQLYSIEELPKQAQHKSYEKWLLNYEYPFHNDNQQTLQAFNKLFDFIYVKEFNYNAYDGYIYFEFNGQKIITDCYFGISGLRLHKWIVNNYYDSLYPARTQFSQTSKKRTSKIFKDNSCVLSGYYQDDTILYPMYQFIQRPTNISMYELIKKCLNEFAKACQEDYYHCQTFEYFLETSQNNEWEYTSNGKYHI